MLELFRFCLIPITNFSVLQFYMIELKNSDMETIHSFKNLFTNARFAILFTIPESVFNIVKIFCKLATKYDIVICRHQAKLTHKQEIFSLFPFNASIKI